MAERDFSFATTKEAVEKPVAAGKHDFSFAQPASEVPVQRPVTPAGGVMGEIKGLAETALTVGTGAVAQPISGLAGALTASAAGAERGAKAVETVQEKLTYDPSSEEGRRNLQAVAKILRPVSDLLAKAEKASGDFGFDIAGPVGGAIASALPTAVMEFIGLKGAAKISKQPKPPANINVDAGDTPTPSDVGSVMDEIKAESIDTVADAANADPAILAAAEELGVELNPGSASENRAFIDAEQSLKSRPGSEIAAIEDKAIKDLGDRADELIESAGGATDKAQIDLAVNEELASTVEQMTMQSDDLYAQVEKAVAPDTAVDPAIVTDYLGKKLKELGGDESLLTNAEKRLKTLVDGEKFPTYAALDRVRKNVGDGFKRKGMFADDEIGTLESVYAVLIKDQTRAAKKAGVQSQFKTANDLVFKRKGVEKDMIGLYGKQLSGSIVSKISSAATKIVKGDVSDFKKLMKAVPANLRSEVAATMLNDIFASGSRNKSSMSGGFATAFQSLNRNAMAKAELFKYLPPGASQRFNMIGKVATGIYRSKALENNSRTARDLLAALEDGGMMGRMYGVGGNIAKAEAVTSLVGAPGVGAAGAAAAGVIGGIMSKFKKPATQAADEFLASAKFSQAVKMAAAGKVKAAEEVLTKSQKYQRWLKHAAKPDTDKISKRGFIAWLAGSGELQANREEQRR